MVVGFRHKGLRRFFGRGDTRAIDPRHAQRLRRVLSLLHQAEGLNNLRPFVFLRLHPLKGDQGGRWAVDVSGNWRITFSVNADGAFDELDYEDYH